MFLELIATFIAGLAAAGVVMLVNRTIGGRIPRWFTPVAAGGAMIALTISNEYSWYNRTVQALPDGFEIAVTVEDTAIYRPWTYMRPFVSRFIAIDQQSIRTNDVVPNQRIAEVFFFGRWSPVQKIAVLFDCADSRRADLVEGVEFGSDGEISGVDWRDTGPEDPLVRAACEGAV